VIDTVVTRRLSGLLGLGLRGRLVVVGVEQVRNAVERGRLVLAFVAPDGSRHSREKVVPLLRARRVPVLEHLSAELLGAAVGRRTTTAVGIIDRQLANGLREIVASGPGGTPEEAV
jgi:ribosomal protein L7Ae-like RNA K-turn-binding protein